MAKNQNTAVPPKPPKNQGAQKPAEKTPELEQTDKQPIAAASNNKATTVTVRTIGVPGGRRFRAGIEFTSTAREIDLGTLKKLQRSAIESDPHLKID
ncbi:MAG: hypothetical protein K2X63_00255 [Burkholderiaceae bacterium]|nr:hypothetical protein [Burkholderiaceae bacterium]